MSLPGLPDTFRAKDDKDDSFKGLPSSFKKRKEFTKKEKAKDITEQVLKKGVSSIAGAYGNLLDLIHGQTQQRQTPAQEALSRLEFEAPESLLPFLQDENIIPQFTRLASQPEAESLIEMLGGPQEAQTPEGRIAGRGIEFIGGSLPLGASSKLLALLGAAGGGGQLTRELGGPEALAKGIELIPLAQAGYQIGKGIKGAKTPLKHPSGIPVRKFENLKKPTPVFEKTAQNVRESIENDFRKITSDLLKKTNKSYAALSENPEFKQQVGSIFEKVKNSASEFPEPIKPRGMIKTLTQEVDNIGKHGISLSDSEKVKRHLLKKYRNDIVNKSVTAEKLLDQYRKNNKDLSKLNPYGDKALENIGKREALEIYNRAISSAIEEHYPNSDYSNLFKFSNQRWSEIKKIENIDKYLNALFGKDKIAFKQAEKIFTDPKKAEYLKNAIGNEAFSDFKQLHKDLLSQENALKLLKSKGYEMQDLSTAATTYILKPSLAKAKFGADFVTKLYRRTLSDPAMVREWKKAMTDLKKGKVSQALTVLNQLSKEEKKD